MTDKTVPQAEETATISEWRIPTTSNGAITQSEGYRSSDFRDPSTGESLLPTKLYIEFARDIQKVSTWSLIKSYALVYFLYRCVVEIPRLMIDGEDLLAQITKVFLWIILAIVALVLAGLGLFRIVKTLMTHVQQHVHLRRNTFLEHNIAVGYSQSNGYVWLKKESDWENANCSSCASPKQYPPIYLHVSVPGDIHVDETEYHPNMIMDEKTWTLIKEMHALSAKKYLGLLMQRLPWG